MNFALAKEIYGQPWSVDAVSLMHLSSILKNIQNGVALDSSDVKLNSVTNIDSIGVINLNGVITKNGGQSSNGTKYLSSQLLQMTNEKKIKGIIIKTDSGGGATGAVQLMIDAINSAKTKKPVYAVIEKGGMAGSAAYGIISACTGVYSEDPMNIVGSVGTMIQFSGKPHGNVDRDGEKTIVLYATKSTAKNKSFEEALNNDNYEMLVNELLDPINENFIANVLSNRPQLQSTDFDNGHTVFSKDAIGTFIDGIASFEEVVNKILTTNIKTMNVEQLKNEHPSVYSEILQAGVAQEQERVASWNAFRAVDSKEVELGIASGLAIKQSEINSFIMKATNLKAVNDLKSDNAESFSTKETTISGEVDTNAELDKAFNF